MRLPWLRKIRLLLKVPRLTSHEINPRAYGLTMFNQNAKTTQREEDRLFNKWHWETNRLSARKGMKLDPYLIPFRKMD